MKAPTQRTYRILVVAAVAVMVACSWFKPIESLASEQIDAGLKRALITFASARALNAAISSVQGTEISAGLVVGGTLSVGQVLDPLNDVVEQFSSLMLVASVAFGMQKALHVLGSSWLVSVVFTAAAAVWAALYLRGAAPDWIRRVVVVLLVVRFAIPVAVIGADQVFEALHAREYQASQSFISETSRQMDHLTLEGAEAEAEKGVWEKVMERVRKFIAGYKQIKLAAENATEKVISLTVIFLLQTIVVPLAILWSLRCAAGFFLRRA